MPERTFHHGILYNLNFIPPLSFMTLLLVAVYVLPSSNKLPGYIFVAALFAISCFLWLREKRKLAQSITVNEETILASGFFTKDTSISWKDIDLLLFTGKGYFLEGSKIQRYLYAELIAKNNKKITIRRDIHKFDELIRLIEEKTAMTFRPK